MALAADRDRRRRQARAAAKDAAAKGAAAKGAPAEDKAFERFLEDGWEATPVAADADVTEVGDLDELEDLASPTVVDTKRPAARPEPPRPTPAPAAEATPEPQEEAPPTEPDAEVTVRPDGMEATLRVRAPAGVVVERAHIDRWLSEAGVCRGVRDDIVQRMLDTLRQRPNHRVTGTVARGTPPKLPVPASLELQGAADPAPPAEASRALRSHWKTQRLEEAGADAAGLPLVTEGEVVARCHPCVEGEPGMTVRGDRIDPPAPAPAEMPSIGAGLRHEDETVVATGLGYLCLAENELSVVPAVGVSRDEARAWVLALQAPNRSLPPDAVAAALAGFGVVDLDASTVSAALSAVTAPGAVVVAEGKEPQAGTDGQVDLQVDATPRTGTPQEDGSIDFKLRNLVLHVDEGQLLARVSSPTKGRPGRTVTGRAVAARDGRPPELDCGEGVDVTQVGDGWEWTAALEGSVRQVDGVLTVRPVIEVEDVDYRTGHIDFRGDVVVSGAIRGGFHVHATGDVFVDTLENGAEVETAGSLHVQHGILGESTRVVARQDVEAQFVQGARVAAKRMDVGSYLYGARVQVERIRVLGKGERGGVVGGGIWVRESADLAHAGCEYGTVTKIVAGFDRSLAARLKRCEEGLKTCRQFRNRIEAAMATARRETRGQARVRLAELEAMEAKLSDERHGLLQETQERARHGRVAVRGTMHNGVAVAIGGRTFRPTTPVQGVCLGVNAEGELHARPLPDNMEDWQ